ncbi:uncharacterized protein NPIL_610921 [Nephila pilipes]|uniref:WSC domain-containing protein n=1 Tax=Nephila pilipes TaxID=299642 RepID=A0A8X6URZ9_NEPPI|nr:uncharacterized protein NPIL_610921 [Nephila pilipes]
MSISIELRDPLCQELDYDSLEFRVSPGGYTVDVLTQDLCKQLCAKQKFSHIGLIGGTYCLCGNDVSDFESVDSSLCNVYCSGNSEEICGSNDTNIIYTMEAAHIGTVDNISLLIDDQIFFTDEAVKIEAVVEASTKIIITLQFGDGSKYKLSDEPYSVEKYYRVPGEYTVLASVQDITKVNPEIFTEVVITVIDRKTKFKVECPKVVEPETQSNCTLMLISGSTVTINFQMSDDEEISPDIEIPDPFYESVGQSVPPVVNETVGTLLAEEVHLTYVNVKMKSRLLGFVYYVMEKGKFELLILRPKCDSDSFCEDSLECSSSCNLWNVRNCNDNRALCSYISKCVDMENLPECNSISGREMNYVTKYSFETEESDIGYKYYSIPDEDNYDVFPGDILGFKSDGSSSLWYRNASVNEIENGIQDTSDGEGLGVLHYLQAILVEPVNVSLMYTYNKTGNYSVSVVLKDLESEYSEVTYLPVQIPVSDVYLAVHQVNVIVGKEISACIKANGSNLNLYWDYFGTEEQEKFDDPVPEGGIFKNITCSSSGDYILNVNVSNLWNSESATAEFHCFEPIGKNWSFNSNSPKSTPTGYDFF